MKYDYLIFTDDFILTPELRGQVSFQFKHNPIFCSTC